MNDFPLISLSDYPRFSEIPDQYPLEYMEQHGCMILDENDSHITVGLINVDDELVEDLNQFHNQKISFVRLDTSEFASYLGKRAASISSLEKIGGSTKLLRDKHYLDKLANDAPIINLVNSIIIDAIRKHASDIHIEAFEDKGSVRIRIDGILHEAGSLDIERFPAISSRLKIMAGLNIMEKRLPQDGRFSVTIGEEVIDIRISTVPVSKGESIVLRIFAKRKEAFSLKSLGFPNWGVNLVEQMTRRSNGLCIVTGPTGSGKSTSLYAVLRELNRPESMLITIEDPVEQEIQGINQIQVNEQIGLNFSKLLRRILRQDPDIIMVGEIRDRETAELSIRAAMTGHLVFSTLHTNDAVSSIHRLCNMGIPAYLLGAVLRGVLAQRLVRKLCPACSIEQELSGSDQEFARRNHWDLKRAFFPKGCKDCGNTGYKGRIPLMEAFVNSPDLEDLIAREVSTTELKQHLSQVGMKSLIDDGYEKVRTGMTSIEEIERAVNT